MLQMSAGETGFVCNLYNLTTNQQAIRDFVRITHDIAGNLEPDLDVYPDRQAPVVRQTDQGRELSRLTWGMPSRVRPIRRTSHSSRSRSLV